MGGTGSGTSVTPIGSVSFDLFLPEVLPHVPGCPVVIALNAIRNACREFCRMSTIWRDWLGPLTSVVDQPTYTLLVDAGTEVVVPTKVRYDGNDIDAAAREVLDHLLPNWESAESGTPTQYLVETQGTIRLYVPPDEATADIIEVEAALKPSAVATAVGDVVYNDWLETIAAGAISRLMKIPKADWSDIKLAVYYETIFQDGVAMARHTVDVGHVKRSRQAKMMRW